jgi:hypothetical protein
VVADAQRDRISATIDQLALCGSGDSVERPAQFIVRPDGSALRRIGRHVAHSWWRHRHFLDPGRCSAHAGCLVPRRPHRGPDDEWQEDGHALTIRLKRADPKAAEEEGLVLPLHMDVLPPTKMPGYEAGFVLPLAQQWTASEHCLYTFELFIDGRRAKSVAITVRPPLDEERAQTG